MNNIEYYVSAVILETENTMMEKKSRLLWPLYCVAGEAELKDKATYTRTKRHDILII